MPLRLAFGSVRKAISMQLEQCKSEMYETCSCGSSFLYSPYWIYFQILYFPTSRWMLIPNVAISCRCLDVTGCLLRERGHLFLPPSKGKVSKWSFTSLCWLFCQCRWENLHDLRLFSPRSLNWFFSDLEPTTLSPPAEHIFKQIVEIRDFYSCLSELSWGVFLQAGKSQL